MDWGGDRAKEGVRGQGRDRRGPALSCLVSVARGMAWRELWSQDAFAAPASEPRDALCPARLCLPAALGTWHRAVGTHQPRCIPPLPAAPAGTDPQLPELALQRLGTVPERCRSRPAALCPGAIAFSPSAGDEPGPALAEVTLPRVLRCVAEPRLTGFFQAVLTPSYFIFHFKCVTLAVSTQPPQPPA